ncbi:hypothetical protein CASFOL_029524 [Castilleja foliolosa]|uniref:MD-2-related lipid-recognition domain-containing protein n=1 Tax=Castilleja foliolosa TaxID=1961234 RepID=A0ABD3C2D0_9LAMI
MAQLNPLALGTLLVTLCLLVPSASPKSIDVHSCDKNADYAVNVSGVDITPFPVSRAKNTNFTVFASTGKSISGGKIKIDVSYFGFHVHNENHDLCGDLLCPVSVGDFVLSHSLELPIFIPPGSYTLRMTMDDENKKQLTCFTFNFSVGFLASETLSDV